MLKELIQPGWEETADYVHGRDTKNGTSELTVTAVLKPQTVDNALGLEPATFGECTECLAIVPRISQLQQGMSESRSSYICVASVKPQLNSFITGLQPAMELDWLHLQNTNPVHVSNCSGPSLWVSVWVNTQPLPNWLSG
jgi:hypothetical protein